MLPMEQAPSSEDFDIGVIWVSARKRADGYDSRQDDGSRARAAGGGEASRCREWLATMMLYQQLPITTRRPRREKPGGFSMKCQPRGRRYLRLGIDAGGASMAYRGRESNIIIRAELSRGAGYLAPNVG